LFNQHLGSTS